MDPILPIAFPGVVAATRRRRVAADNVEAQDPAAYTAEPADQVTLSSGDTEAVPTNTQPGTVVTHDPTAHHADANGLVAQPNVDPVEETVRQQLTSRTDSALSVQVARVYSQTQKALLDIEA